MYFLIGFLLLSKFYILYQIINATYNYYLKKKLDIDLMDKDIDEDNLSNTTDTTESVVLSSNETLISEYIDEEDTNNEDEINNNTNIKTITSPINNLSSVDSYD
uniref:Uncharacterized protein n=1 Tax=viral metagenome TaxID=1070528 RepID=A0A6C0EEX5_9ZZZZ